MAAREKLSFNQECTPTLIWTKLVKGAMFAPRLRERESSLCEQHLYDQNGSLLIKSTAMFPLEPAQCQPKSDERERERYCH